MYHWRKAELEEELKHKPIAKVQEPEKKKSIFCFKTKKQDQTQAQDPSTFIQNMLDPEKRLEMIMQTFSLQQKLLINDEGQIVVVGQVVVPEHAN